MSTEHVTVQLAERPKGKPTDATFSIQSEQLKPLESGKARLKTLYLSVDPYMRGRMSDAKSYVAPFPLNEVITGGGVGQVVESETDELKTGQIVIGSLGWQEYNDVKPSEVRVIDPEAGPLSAHLGILGMTGLTAYFGLLEIGQPKPGETVVVSGAAGAVGSVVGQIAKLKGAHVIGIAGTEEKCDWLVKELGFDQAINYRTTDDMTAAIAEAAPNGVDVYFDNVGGAIADAVLANVNDFARVPVCGAISTYNDTEQNLGPRVQGILVKNRVRMQGFLVNDFSDKFKQGAGDLGKWVQNGELKYEESVTEGIRSLPEAFVGLFDGKNIGKQIVKVAEPEA